MKGKAVKAVLAACIMSLQMPEVLPSSAVGETPEEASYGVPLFRVYNPNASANNHFYTSNASERDCLASIGWNDEEIGWYGMQ